jgi:hypothetical protein
MKKRSNYLSFQTKKQFLGTVFLYRVDRVRTTKENRL